MTGNIFQEILTPETQYHGDFNRFGGKAKNLYYLSRHHLPVPNWFCISSHYFERMIEQHHTAIETWLTQGEYEQNALHIEAIFYQSAVKWGLIDAIASRLHTSKSYAVRSSAVGEDEAAHSFAGQFETFLVIPATQVPQAMIRCWLSVFAPRVNAYLERQGKTPWDFRMAVVVQEMILSHAAGVLFQSHPAGSLNETLVVAGYGLGEGIVSDQVETDHYTYDLLSDTLEWNIHSKTKRVVPDTTGTQLETVPEILQNQSALSEVQVKELLTLSQKIAEHYSHPQDIEWALDQEERFYILQSRPITTIPRGPRYIFDNSNIVESYPGITAPLTFSYIRPGYESLFRNAARRLGIPETIIHEKQAVFANMVGYIQGRIYYNLTNWYDMFRIFPGTERYIAVWEEMMGIGQGKTTSRHSLGEWLGKIPALLRVFGRAFWYFLTLDGEMKAFRHRFQVVHDDFWKQDHLTLSNHDLICVFEDINRQLMTGWEITLLNDGYAFIFSGLTKAMLKRLDHQDESHLFNALISGEKDLESAKPIYELINIAEYLRKNPEIATHLKNIKDATSYQQGFKHQEAHQFYQWLESYLQKFGDRNLSELKLESPSFREQPWTLIQRVLDYVSTELSVSELQAREGALRLQTEAHVRNQFSPFQYWQFKHCLKHARRTIAYRESARLDRARAFGMIRHIFKTIATHFVEEGVLATSEDIFYLGIDEIFGYIRGSSLHNTLQPLVEYRKNSEKDNRESSPAERLLLQGTVYKNFIPHKQAPFFSQDKHILKGTPCSAGQVIAPALVVKQPAEARDYHGKILVAEMTDPGWVFLMVAAAGLIVEKGSLLSHTAIIGRELGIPTVVGVKGATQLIANGQSIALDGNTGIIKVIY